VVARDLATSSLVSLIVKSNVRNFVILQGMNWCWLISGVIRAQDMSQLFVLVFCFMLHVTESFAFVFIV
jgi:hypothetical protein